MIESSPHSGPRLCVLGAGGIGGGIGVRLHQAGHRVTLVARGAHLAAMQHRGLRVLSPAGVEVVAVCASATVPDDAEVILLAVKATDLATALPMIPPGRPVVCLQNGLGSARRVAGAGHPAIATMIFVPATHLEPGEVRLHGSPHFGVVDVGPFSDETTALSAAVVAMLRGAGIDSVARPDIMAWKRGKLLTNLAGGLQVACGDIDPTVHRMLMDEATAIFAALDLPWITPEALIARAKLVSRPAGGHARQGGSMWQSLVRGRPLELQAIYGDLVALGRQAGVDAPMCARLMALLATVERPGRFTTEALRARLIEPDSAR